MSEEKYKQIRSKVANEVWEFGDGEQLVLNAQYSKEFALIRFKQYLRSQWEISLFNSEQASLSDLEVNYIVNTKFLSKQNDDYEDDCSYYISDEFVNHSRAAKVWILNTKVIQ